MGTASHTSAATEAWRPVQSLVLKAMPDIAADLAAQRQSWRLARAAPCANASSFAQAICGWMRPPEYP
jgi:hypothetical protein